MSYPNKPYINGRFIYSAFRWCINLNFKKCTLMTGLMVQGHISGIVVFLITFNLTSLSQTWMWLLCTILIKHNNKRKYISFFIDIRKYIKLCITAVSLPGVHEKTVGCSLKVIFNDIIKMSKPWESLHYMNKH